MINDGQGNITAPSLTISGVTKTGNSNPKTFIADSNGNLKITANIVNVSELNSGDSNIPLVVNKLQVNYDLNCGNSNFSFIRPLASGLPTDPNRPNPMDTDKFTTGFIGFPSNDTNWGCGGTGVYGNRSVNIIGYGLNTGDRKVCVWDKLYVANSLFCNTSGNLSDYRLKSNVRDIDEFTTLNLRPVQYELNSYNEHRIGLIAHELQETFPFMVLGEKDGEAYQSVNYISLIGVLIHEIQHMKKKMNILETEIEYLKNK